MKQNTERLNRIKKVYELIKEKEWIGIEEITKNFPELSFKTLREYIKTLFSMELLEIDSHSRYKVIKEFPNVI